jgi:hypothetical protein
LNGCAKASGTEMASKRREESVAKCMVECRYSRKRWIAVANVDGSEGIGRTRGVYIGLGGGWHGG